MHNVCYSYSQRYEESFFSLEQLPNTHGGEKMMKESQKS